MQQPATSTYSYGKELMARGQAQSPLFLNPYCESNLSSKKGSKYGEHVSDLEQGWIGPCLALLPLNWLNFGWRFARTVQASGVL
jgi:hypothetical protein